MREKNSLLLTLHLLDEILIILEVCAIKCLEVGAPDFEFSSELFVHGLITEDWIAWILHQIQVFK